jgi:catechol 2,3-dioxygenase-like lactoylglutathione lyase family enzyme
VTRAAPNSVPSSAGAERNSLSVRSIFHVGFVVRNLDASIYFYCEGLGLVLRHRQLQHNAYTAELVGYPDALLEVAQFQFSEGEPPPSGHILELVCYERPASGPAHGERNTLGVGHLAFVVDDIFESAARLRGLGAELVSEPVRITSGINAGGWTVYLRDPDGVNLELVQPRRNDEADDA